MILKLANDVLKNNKILNGPRGIMFTTCWSIAVWISMVKTTIHYFAFFKSKWNSAIKNVPLFLKTLNHQMMTYCCQWSDYVILVAMPEFLSMQVAILVRMWGISSSFGATIVRFSFFKSAFLLPLCQPLCTYFFFILSSLNEPCQISQISARFTRWLYFVGWNLDVSENFLYISLAMTFDDNRKHDIRK